MNSPDTDNGERLRVVSAGEELEPEQLLNQAGELLMQLDNAVCGQRHCRCKRGHRKQGEVGISRSRTSSGKARN